MKKIHLKNETIQYSHKAVEVAEGVTAVDYGWGLYADDTKSSIKNARYKRQYIWNERNLLKASIDSSCTVNYVYGVDGQRSNKFTTATETLYFSKLWTVHTDSGNITYGGQVAKNIYLGESRIVTKLNSGNNPSLSEELHRQYFYHSDHLGSATLITDKDGKEYQRIEYTSYGELWVEKTSNIGSDYLPYKFTGKEMDEETGLYYYGARYLNPKLSRWMSADPALGEYMAGSDAGCGGIYNIVNFNLYHYAGNNPIKYTDPTGLYDEENGYSKDEINAFKNMNVKDQLAYLKSEIHSVSEGTTAAGSKASFMRSQLKDKMKLEGLFYNIDGDEKFMNESLRDFLNSKENGTDYTIVDVLKNDSGWSRMNIGDGEHQHNQNGGRNQKFINKDGREAVFDSKNNFIGDGLDKGTYNFAVPTGLGKLTSWGAGYPHGRYDMKPFFRQNHIQPLYWRTRVGSNYGWNAK